MIRTLRADPRQADPSASAVLVAGGLTLVVPRDEVGAPLHRDSVDVASRRVVALDERTAVMAGVPADRYVLTTLGRDPSVLWAWSEVRLPREALAGARPMPAVLAGPGSAFTGYLDLDGSLAFVTDARRLLAHVFASATP